MLVVLGWPNAHTMPSPKFIQYLHMLNVSSMIKGKCIKEKCETLHLKEWFHRIEMNAKRAKPKRIWWKVFLSYSIYFMCSICISGCSNICTVCVSIFFLFMSIYKPKKNKFNRISSGSLPIQEIIIIFTHRELHPH